MGNKKIDVGIIGLGKFGFALAETLVELGHDVLGIDGNMDMVRRAQGTIAHAYQASGTDIKALEELHFRDLDYVVVSTGNTMAESILTAMNLLDLKIPNIWVKAVSDEHERVLTRLGVHRVMFPEQDVARQMAYKMAVPGLLDYLPLGEGVLVREAVVDTWDGSSLMELALPVSHQVQVVAVKKHGSAQFSFVPKASEPLEKGDVLVLVGELDSVSSLKT